MAPERSREARLGGAERADPDGLSMRDGAQRLVVGLIAVYAVFTMVNVALWSERHPPAEVAIDVIMIAFLAGTLAVLRRAPPTVRNGHWIGLGVALATVADVTASAFLNGDPATLTYVPYVTIGLSALVLWAEVFFALGAIALVVATVSAWRLGEADLLLPLTANGAAIAAGYAIFAARRGSLARLRDLRATDDARKAELEHAFECLGEELQERERAEQEREEVLQKQAALEAQLREAQKLESIGVLAGGMAHDMNNVLAAISSIASAGAAHPHAPPELAEDLRQIVAASEQGAALTRNLLGFAGQGMQRREPIDVAETIEDVVALLRRTIPKGIEVSTEIDGDLPTVIGDSGQLRHVWMNLCLNAVDAIGERGSVVIRATTEVVAAPHAQLAAGTYVAVSVRDDGCGMSRRTVARAFEPFFSTKTERGRSGLGLSMVYGTLRQHGGDVRIDSAVGEGTTVTVLLPPGAASRLTPAPSSPVTGLPSDLQVLVVDDEPLVRRGVGRLLESLGARVTLASSGAEGVAAFRRLRAQKNLVVLLDLAMPEMSGAETFHALSAIDPGVSVVVASGYPRGHDVDHLVEAGVRGYLSKPYGRQALVEALTVALGATDATRRE